MTLSAWRHLLIACPTRACAARVMFAASLCAIFGASDALGVGVNTNTSTWTAGANISIDLTNLVIPNTVLISFERGGMITPLEAFNPAMANMNRTINYNAMQADVIRIHQFGGNQPQTICLQLITDMNNNKKVVAIPCPPPGQAGACAVGPNCLPVTPMECATAGGTYQGDGTSCDNVPTMSEWGLIALAASMMAGGALLLRTRRTLPV